MIAKNNIFNIRAAGARWIGMTGVRKGFVEFDNQDHAVRAWWILMRTYRQKHGCTTIQKIVTRFAPPSENDTARYISYCGKIVGIGVDAPLNDHQQYARLAVAMARMETGTTLTSAVLLNVREQFVINVIR